MVRRAATSGQSPGKPGKAARRHKNTIAVKTISSYFGSRKGTPSACQAANMNFRRANVLHFLCSFGLNRVAK